MRDSGSAARFGGAAANIEAYTAVRWITAHREIPVRHAIQHFYYQRVASGVETTAWYEESVAVVHMTCDLIVLNQEAWPLISDHH